MAQQTRNCIGFVDTRVRIKSSDLPRMPMRVTIVSFSFYYSNYEENNDG